MAVFPEVPVRTPVAVKLLEIQVVWRGDDDHSTTYRLVVRMDDGTTATIGGDLASVLPTARHDTVLNWINTVAGQAAAEVIP